MIKAIIFDFFGVIEVGGEPNKPLLDFIKNSLKPKYKIAMISNSSGRGARELLKEELDIFDELVFSGEVGISKPHTSIFEITANRLHLEPQECVFIDDSALHCEGAQASGMRAIVYEDYSQMISELEALLKPVSDN